jgi:outer membrane lipoprotein-sorting protein
MRPAEEIKKLVKNLYDTTSAQMDERVLKDALAALEETKKTKSALTEPIFWRIIMKSNITKFAAAAVIIIAVTLGVFHFGSGSVTWAKVIAPILKARTVSFDVTIGTQANSPVIHDMIMGSRIRRTISNMTGINMIIDLEQMKMLTLVDANKSAVLVKLDNLSSAQGNLKSYIEHLRNAISGLQNKPDFKVESLGLQKFNGQNYLVFVATSANDMITIWADPQTALPSRIEHKTPNMQVVCDNVQFDIPLDESLFSMDIPEGYTVQSTGIDYSKNSEADFIETLRIWAQIIENGQFPDSIGLENITETGTKLGLGLERANLSQQQMMDIATKWGQGYVFIRFFKGQGQWHYAGKGVKLGDADTPIFWYQPQNSQTWRVIYGDLSVADVEPENLPK